MEKGWLIGIFIGLVVVFAVFMVGFYSGNSITGEFFHTKRVQPTSTMLAGEQLKTELNKLNDIQLKDFIQRSKVMVDSASKGTVAIGDKSADPKKAERLASQIYTSRLEDRSPPSIETLVIPRNQYTRRADGSILVRNAYIAVLNDNLEEVWEELKGGGGVGPEPIDPMAGSAASGGCACVQSCVCPPSPNCSCDPPNCGSCSPCPSCPDN